jgi:23S rRNA (cytidine1920-2'-O)/16S rRNA (cytidine1409-2'-O)-methyltransferase
VAKVRLDHLVLASGLAPSRARAQAVILAGRVLVAGKPVDKVGSLVDEEAVVALKGEEKTYVSRGGEKLAGALDAFDLDVHGLRCLDLGASTGGFTDCLLRRGASHVVAVDVGYGQLAYALRVDPRVTVRERTNARALQPDSVGGPADLTVVDASFISLAKLLPAIVRCTREGGTLVALVKPQFEVGRAAASRGKGVVRDEGERTDAIARVVGELVSAGLDVLAQRDSVLLGPKGNREAFVHARRRATA